MILRLIHLACCFALLPALALAQSPQPTIVPASPGMEGPIKLPDAPLEVMLQTLELWTGRTVLRPSALPAAQGGYNLVINKQVTRAEALLALETVLAMNGIGLAPLGDQFIKVVPIQSLRTEAPQFISGSTLDFAPSGAIASKIFTFDFMRANELMGQLSVLLNSNLGGAILVPNANAALITDSISNLQRIELLVRELDKPVTAGMTPKFYSLQFSKASDLVTKLRTVLQGNLATQLGTSTTYSADDRTNQLILVADKRLHPFFDELVEKLDVKADPNTRNDVIYLKHANAPDVATLLSQLVSGQNQATTKASEGSVRPGEVNSANDAQNRRQQRQAAQAGNAAAPTAETATAVVEALGSSNNEFSSLVTILADERSNAVLVSGTVDDIRLLRELVDKIDVLLAQVRIEVVIAEVTLTQGRSSGISQLGLNMVGERLVSGNLTAAGLSVVQSSSSSGDLVLDLGFTSDGKTKSDVAILSNPTIVTTHNKEASIFVGESRPIITGSQSTPVGVTGTTSGFSTSSTVSYRDIGIQLTVKPLIGVDGSVQLEITQDVESKLDDVLIDGNLQPVIGTRTTESFISVRDGDIIVLGGLQSLTENTSKSRLGPIPIIGDLLGQKKKTSQRTDLLFFLRPRILANNMALDNASAMQRLDAMPTGATVKTTLDSGVIPDHAPEPKDDKSGPKLGPRH